MGYSKILFNNTGVPIPSSLPLIPLHFLSHGIIFPCGESFVSGYCSPTTPVVPTESYSSLQLNNQGRMQCEQTEPYIFNSHYRKQRQRFASYSAVPDLPSPHFLSNSS